MSYKSVAPLYRYRTLEGHRWIRVLQLWPSDAITDLLQGEIVHVDRDLEALHELAHRGGVDHETQTSQLTRAR